MNSYVYVIQDISSDAVKIGKSNDIEKRLASLQTGNPRKLNIIMRIGPYSEEKAFEAESHLHNLFDKYRISGEWFSHHVMDAINDAEIGKIKINGIVKDDIFHSIIESDTVVQHSNEPLIKRETDVLADLFDRLKTAWVSASLSNKSYSDNGADIILHINKSVYAGIVVTDESFENCSIDKSIVVRCRTIFDIPECVAWAIEAQERYMYQNVRYAQ